MASAAGAGKGLAGAQQGQNQHVALNDALKQAQNAKQQLIRSPQLDDWQNDWQNQAVWQNPQIANMGAGAGGVSYVMTTSNLPSVSYTANSLVQK